mgnify:CR=1 FL=1
MVDQRLKSKALNIKTGSIFPWHFQLIAVVIVIGSVALFLTNMVLSLVLLIVGMAMLTSYSGILVDTSKKTYRAYYSVLQLKIGDVVSYEGIEKIFVNANKESQKIYTSHTLDSNTFKNIVYDGYLKFMDGNKIHLISKKNKPAVMHKLNEYADFLAVELQDNTPDNLSLFNNDSDENRF